MSPLNISLGLGGMSPNAATAIGLDPAVCTPSGLYTAPAPNSTGWGLSANGLGASPVPYALSLGSGLGLPSTTANADAQLFDCSTIAGNLLPFGSKPPTRGLLNPERTFANDGMTSHSRPAMDSLFSPLSPSKSKGDRQMSHRESERRRRESMKSSLGLLESMVQVMVDQAKESPLNEKGRNKGSATSKLSHAETYRLACEMITALKSEIATHRREVDRLARGC